ncbi:MAG: ferredoxin--NADP reductase [Pseudohongiellaceae bacterium]
MKWIEGTVVENLLWTENLFSLKIAADAADFTAGQFTSLALDIEGERVARPYSYLSSPGEQPLEFFFYTAVDGVLSNALIKLEPGDPVWVREKAAGFFTLDEVPPAREMWMMGTGTGVAPFFSILRTEEPWQRFDHIVLAVGVRTQADLRYQHLIDDLRNQYGERFHYQPFISREDVTGAIRGRIPASIESGTLEVSVNRSLSVEESHIMLCGNPDMVKDATAVLKLRGFQKNLRRKPGHITVENYW